MGAPTDRPEDPNIGARAVWLRQVSEAASALAATQVPEQLSGGARPSKISVGSTIDGRAVWVGQVSEGASAVPASHGPGQFSGNPKRSEMLVGFSFSGP